MLNLIVYCQSMGLSLQRDYMVEFNPGRNVLRFYGPSVTERLYGGPVSGWAFSSFIEFSSSPRLGFRSPDSPHSAEKNKV